MDPHEKAIIAELFGRLRRAEQQGGSRDLDAEVAILDAIERQPAAPYYMVQAMLVQEHALKALNERVRQLEHELTNPPVGGGFLAGLFGGGPPAPAPLRPLPPPSPLPRARPGSFLTGAAQTALGVAGGALLGGAIAELLSDAAEPAAPAAKPTELLFHAPDFEDAADAGDDELFM